MLDLKPRLVSALLTEIELRQTYLSGEAIETVYFGGGTPSLLSSEELQSIITALNAAFTVLPNAEITLEANPDDISLDTLRSWKQAGINRLSIGLQSFNAAELKWMNRAHTAEQSLSAVKLAQQEGFDNITIDLIYGSRFQDLDSWHQTLVTVLDLGIQHISAYNLTVEDRTRLGNAVLKGNEPAINEDLSSQQFMMLSQVLRDNGFQHYEISNFGLAGFEAKHNSNYWRQKAYLGLGPSAHSFNGSNRQWNLHNNPAYIRSLENNKLEFKSESLSVRDLYNEYVMTRLRTTWGCDLTEIESRFGIEYVQHFKNMFIEYQNDFNVHAAIYVLKDSARLRADGIASAFFILQETTD